MTSQARRTTDDPTTLDGVVATGAVVLALAAWALVAAGHTLWTRDVRVDGLVEMTTILGYGLAAWSAICCAGGVVLLVRHCPTTWRPLLHTVAAAVLLVALVLVFPLVGSGSSAA